MKNFCELTRILPVLECAVEDCRAKDYWDASVDPEVVAERGAEREWKRRRMR